MKKIITGLVTTVALLFVAVVIILKLMFPAERVQALVVEELASQINRRITLDEVGLSVFPSIGIDVTGLTIFDQPNFSSSDPFVRFDRFVLKVKFWPLLRRELIVDELVFVRPVISIIVNEQGTANYEDLAAADSSLAPTPAPSSEETAIPFSVQVSGIRIEQGVLSYTNHQADIGFEVGRLDNMLSLSFEQPSGPILSTGTLTMSDIRIQRPEGLINGIEARLDHDVAIDKAGKIITVNALTVSLQQMALTLMGEITAYDTDTPAVDLKVASSDITIEKLLDSMPSDLAAGIEGTTGSGRIGIEGTVQGPVGKNQLPDIHATLKLREGRVQSPELPIPIEQVTGEFRLQNANLTIKQLAAKMGRSDFAFQGTVTDLYGGPSSARPQARLTVTSSFLNLDEIIPPVDAGTPVKSFVPYPDVVLTGKGQAQRVLVRGLELTDASLQISLQDQVLRLTDISAGTYGGRLTGSITQDLTNIQQPQLQFDTNIEKVDVGEFLSAFLPVKGLLSGRFSTSFSADGPLEPTGFPVRSALNAIGSLSIGDGHLTNWPPLRKLSSFLKVPDVESVDFRSLVGAFRMEQGRLITDKLLLSGPKGDWVANGSVGLDGSLDYGMQITFSEALSSRVGNGLAGHALSLFRDDQGHVGVTFSVKGMLDAPQFDWDVKKQVTTRLKQEGQKLLQDKTQQLLNQTPLKSMSVDSLKEQAQSLVKSNMDSVKGDLSKKATDVLKGLFKRK